MTTFRYTEEPPDGTILASNLVDTVIVRCDAAANDKYGNPERRWYEAVGTTDVVTFTWAAVSREEWQRLYRQSEVDALLAAERAKVSAEIAAALDAKAHRLDALSDEIEDAEAGATAYADAAAVARKHREEPK